MLPKPVGSVLSMTGLENYLMSSITCLGVKFDFELVIRPYSKTMYGYYDHKNNRIVIYAYKDPEHHILYPVQDLLDTLLHEISHYIQYRRPGFMRFKGVMHDSEFYGILNDLRRRVNSIDRK